MLRVHSTGRMVVGKYPRQTCPQQGQRKTSTVFKLFLYFPPPTRKSQPLLETSCVIQRNIPTKSCRRQLRPPPSPEPRAQPCAPHLASTFPVPQPGPGSSGGFVFPFPSQHLAERQRGRASVERCLHSLGRAGSLVLHEGPSFFPCKAASTAGTNANASSTFGQWGAACALR